MARGGAGRGQGRKPGSVTAKTKALRAAIAKDRAITAARTITEIGRLALSDIIHAFDQKTGRLKSLKDMPPAFRCCISSIKVTKQNLTAGDGVQEDVVEVKLWDKIRALEMAAKHHGLLIERVQVSGEVTLGEKVARARARLQKKQEG